MAAHALSPRSAAPALALATLLAGCKHHPRADEADPTACFARHATALSGDDMEGRGVGTAGLDKAAAYLQGEYSRLGLEPVGAEYKQEFGVTTGVALGADNRLAAGDEAWTVGEGFMPLGFSGSGAVEGSVVFAGYGITAKDLDYDDYAGLDVTGKVVLAMRYEPGEEDDASPFDGRRPTRWSDLRYKAHLAKQAGAVALVLVAPAREADEPDGLPGLRVGDPTSDAGLPVFQVTRAVADAWLATADQSLAALREAIDAEMKPRSLALPAVSLSGNIALEPTRATVSNIVGILPGTGALADEAVVVGAHYDHLGMGGRGSFRPEEVAIHNGADDNASGVAAMLCGVEQLQKAPPADRRALVVIAFAAEEIGLGGSSWYVNNPAIPLEQTAAMINLDMVGAVRDGQLSALGGDSAPEWADRVAAAATEAGLAVASGGDGYGPSDQTPFYAAGVPVLHLFSGAHERYHTPEDDVGALNMDGGGQVATLLGSLLGATLTEARPTYVRAAAGPAMAGDSRGYGSYLGTIPDYATMMAETGGVLLSDVRPDGPAERAGLRGGDRIVGMAGIEIRNLYDMSFVLRDHRPGETITIVVERDGQRVELLATLGQRTASKEGSGSPHGGGAHGGGDWKPTAGKDASHLLLPEETHLADLRQLTFGGDNAEAYFFPDGRRLIYQFTGSPDTCDQEFIYDLTTGETTLVSSGEGRTTCGYTSWPDEGRFIYATTEGGGEACPPVPDHSQGYVWPLYDSFELVWQDGLDGEPQVFLPSPGYDAEATACQKDGRIVFTSVRDGDLELYTVNADGTDLKRLTHTPGYDGGAFFTHDCSRIVWRASRPEGEALADYQRLLADALVRPGNLEIYTMAADGSDVRQLTRNGAANFGPYPLPDDSGFIYASNAGASVREFDLWVVSADGGEPEQITHAEGFDGFPMYSPDGQWLVFASNRGGDGRETNLFIARWVAQP